MQDRARAHRHGSDGSGQEPLARSATVVVAVTLQRLVDDATRFWSFEEQLVLDALRRSAGHLTDASINNLACYVREMSPEQLRGVAANVKGIYHEMLFVHAANSNGDGIEARLFEATNHPGADVEFIVDGEVIREVQLKAVASPSHIYEHLARYPEIELVATTEMASRFENVECSGFTNAALDKRVGGVIDELPGDSLMQEMAEGVATSALVSAAIGAANVLRGHKPSKQMLASTAQNVALGAGTAAVLDTILDRLL